MSVISNPITFFKISLGKMSNKLKKKKKEDIDRQVDRVISLTKDLSVKLLLLLTVAIKAQHK